MYCSAPKPHAGGTPACVPTAVESDVSYIRLDRRTEKHLNS